MQGRSPSKRQWTPAALVLAVLLALAAPANAATIWAVGDGGVAGPEDDQVASYIQSQGAFDRFLYLGDVYEHGTALEFQTNYHPGFGRFKQITSPTIGNHEWPNHDTGYDPYWGELAPHTDGGHWYSFDVDGWHFVSLNSMEPTEPDSPQIRWLRADLSRYDGTCTMAFMHHPRYSASNGERLRYQPVWEALQGHAVALLSGHDHNYQRLKPVNGIVQLIVGSGGRTFHDVNESDPQLAAENDSEFGALRLALSTGRAGFEFHAKDAAADGHVRDRGEIACTPHTVPQPPAEPPTGQQEDVVPPPASDAPATGAPTVQILTPREGAVHSRRLRSFRGRATNALGPVKLTLVRRSGGRCMRFDGRRLRRAPCGTRRGLRAKGLERWRLTLKRGRRLPPGRYKLSARVSGVGESSARDSVRFKIAR